MREAMRWSSRRGLIKAAAIGLGGLVAARAQIGQAIAQGAAAAPSVAPEIWAAEYWARKGSVDLAMYRKRLGAPQPGEARRPVLVLVHGSSTAAKSSYDLAVPGHGEYSLMNVFAGHGFDVWTLDHEGYGRSSRTEGNSDIASGVEDLKAAVQVIERETGERRYHFYGGSSGALRAGAFAMAGPDRVDRLALEALTWTGKGSPTLTSRAEQLAFYRTHSRRPRGRDMVASIFTRDKPGTSDPAVAEALADADMVYGDSVPTGTYLDMTANLPILDPLRIKSPVIILRGEHDGIATLEDLLGFYEKLPNPDRQFAILAGASHAVALGHSRDQLWHALRGFLTMPTHHAV